MYELKLYVELWILQIFPSPLTLLQFYSARISKQQVLIIGQTFPVPYEQTLSDLAWRRPSTTIEKSLENRQ